MMFELDFDLDVKDGMVLSDALIIAADIYEELSNRTTVTGVYADAMIEKSRHCKYLYDEIQRSFDVYTERMKAVVS